MPIHDKLLEKKLKRQIANLTQTISWVGPTPLRHELDELAVKMYRALNSFDQDAYEDKPKKATA